MEGCRSRRSLYNVPLPTPEGPEMIMGRVSGGTEGKFWVSMLLLILWVLGWEVVGDCSE